MEKKSDKLVLHKQNEKFLTRISLSKLYRNENIRSTVWDILSADFDEMFSQLIKEATNVRSLLINPAKQNRNFLKEMVIEYGYPFECLEDLKNCLDTLNNWDTVDQCDSDFCSQASIQNE